MTEVKIPFKNPLLELGIRVRLPFKIIKNKIFIEVPTKSNNGGDNEKENTV